MDSQERHDLKQNDLQEFILHFGQWWNKHGTTVLVILLLAVGAFTLTRWLSGREQRLLNEAYGDLQATTSPEGLEQVAQSYPNRKEVQAAALLRAADLLLHDAVVTLGQNPLDAARTPEQTRQLLTRAEKNYQQVIDLGGPTLMTLNAHYGLAKTYESLAVAGVGDPSMFAKAKQQYQKVADSAGPFAYMAARATADAERIDRISMPVDFPPAPVPAIESTLPTGPKIGDIPKSIQDVQPAPTPTPEPAPTPEQPAPDAKPQPDGEPKKPDEAPKP